MSKSETLVSFWWIDGGNNTKINCLPSRKFPLVQKVFFFLRFLCEWETLTSVGEQANCRRELLLRPIRLTRTEKAEFVKKGSLDLLLLCVCFVTAHRAPSIDWRQNKNRKKSIYWPRSKSFHLAGRWREARWISNQFSSSASNSICNMLQFLPVKSFPRSEREVFKLSVERRWEAETAMTLCRSQFPWQRRWRSNKPKCGGKRETIRFAERNRMKWDWEEPNLGEYEDVQGESRQWKKAEEMSWSKWCWD